MIYFFNNTNEEHSFKTSTLIYGKRCCVLTYFSHFYLKYPPENMYMSFSKLRYVNMIFNKRSPNVYFF